MYCKIFGNRLRGRFRLRTRYHLSAVICAGEAMAVGMGYRAVFGEKVVATAGGISPFHCASSPSAPRRSAACMLNFSVGLGEACVAPSHDYASTSPQPAHCISAPNRCTVFCTVRAIPNMCARTGVGGGSQSSGIWSRTQQPICETSNYRCGNLTLIATPDNRVAVF